MANPDTKRVLFIFGTRPEAIKLCSLIRELRIRNPNIQVVVCVTGQHREMLQQVLQAFGIEPDFDLAAMTGNQSLNGLSSRLLAGLEDVIQNASPSLTVVQGDTTSTLCGALASFHRRIPVAHVEAGLRTFDLDAPFPEEGNRVLTDRLSHLHFAATQNAAQNLLDEGLQAARVFVTGNTGIDAVLAVEESLRKEELRPQTFPVDGTKRLILVTAHRRESFGPAFHEICKAVAELGRRDDVQILWPVHPNPNVQASVAAEIKDTANIFLCGPLDYVSLVHAMRSSYLILTDSGGIQEEAPALGKPVLVLRSKTERPEGVASGSVKLVGTQQAVIVKEAHRLLDDPAAHAAMAKRTSIYGDGQASKRIATEIEAFLFPAGNQLP